jgi:hypothetical protein
VRLVIDALALPLLGGEGGLPRPDRDHLRSCSVDDIVSAMGDNMALHVSSNLWRALRRWLRLAIVQQGLVNKDAGVAVAYVESVVHANTRALGARVHARLATAAAPAAAAAPPGGRGGYHERKPKPPATPQLRAVVSRMREAAGLPPLAMDEGVPPAPAPAAPHLATAFADRDLLGEVEAVARAQGYHQPAHVAAPPAGAPTEPRARSSFAALAPATRASLHQLAHRLFAAVPYPCTRKGAYARPVAFLPLLHQVATHRSEFRDFLVRRDKAGARTATALAHLTACAGVHALPPTFSGEPGRRRGRGRGRPEWR